MPIHDRVQHTQRMKTSAASIQQRGIATNAAKKQKKPNALRVSTINYRPLAPSRPSNNIATRARQGQANDETK